jgi:hypothetical protein
VVCLAAAGVGFDEWVVVVVVVAGRIRGPGVSRACVSWLAAGDSKEKRAVSLGPASSK